MKQTIYFGLSLDDALLPRPDQTAGISFLGEKKLLQFLEGLLGLGGHIERIEHIRKEQYRQAVTKHLKKNSKDAPFYAASFDADQLACAESLLARRDELLLAGFPFALFLNEKKLPARLRVLVEIESLFSKETPLIAGSADRFEVVLEKIKSENAPDLAIEKIILHEPLDYLPPQYRRLFSAFSARQIPISQAENLDFEPPFAPKTDLDFFKKFVKNEIPQGTRAPLSTDGSILILEAQSDADAANLIAKTLIINPLWRPSVLIPDKNRLLDDALIQNGLPALGLASASLGRPTLQLLKLVTAFLWRPIDLHKILEFVTLATKPLDNDLANVVANCISQRPGLDSDLLFAERSRFFRELEEKALAESSIDVKKIKGQYDFWFDRPTYDIEKSAPKDEITAIFKTLKEWSSEEFEASNGKNSSLLVLSEQARRIEEFLNELPAYESFLSFLELDRIIRTIAEPAPVQPKAQELSSLPFCHREACLIGSVDNLVWWNFADTEGVHFFSRWYKQELAFFKEENISLQSPQDENALMLWRRVQPIVRTHKQLILCHLHRVNGEDTTEHPLMSHLRACFGDIEKITIKVHTSGILDDDTEPADPLVEDSPALKKWAELFQKPQKQPLESHQLGKIEPFVTLNTRQLSPREEETLTSLEDLMYYPHKWVFRHKARLSKSSILTIAANNTLKGNLSHRFFELILEENFDNWTRDDVDEWINNESPRLLRKEAATLLMYGYEPERVQFISQIKYAVWTLISFIQKNGWTVSGTEIDLSGKFGALPVRGKADVVLQRKKMDSETVELCVLDLKWSGHSYRERLIKNGEDVQLVLYSRLLTDTDDWAHTGYFIIENARLLARNTLAFKEIKPLLPNSDATVLSRDIWQKMLKTYGWRVKQIESGQIEIRTNKTVNELEEIYGSELLDVLEMKKEDAAFDDYRVLIGLVV